MPLALAISNQRETAIGWYRQVENHSMRRLPGNARALPVPSL